LLPFRKCSSLCDASTLGAQKAPKAQFLSL
jgi:hypothetical protein